ncbi:hypothetical protein MMC19_005324 [Ptychographa xylographoides]|nr:hypothetical protein [Ptychographa xylographoides]
MSSLTSELHEHVSLLTPLKTSRKKRPSFSPVKSHQPVPKPRTQSEIVQPKPAITWSEVDVATASLEFEEFSFWDAESQYMKNISSEHTKQLLFYLARKYKVFDMQISLPYLILFCQDAIPLQDERPFSIAGCIAVWLKEGDAVPGDISIGDWGEGDEISLQEELALDLKVFHMPKDTTLLGVATQYFPDASFISFISHSLIVEYPKQDSQSWRSRLEKLPSGFRNIGVSLSFSNGPLVIAELKRLKAPKPQSLADLQADDSDYVKSQGCFFPGVMLQAESGDQITAGIAVEKDFETRLTVAFHCWDKEYQAVPKKLGDENHFSVTQAGTLVGYVDKRIGATDIGLAKLNNDVVFHNRFLDIPAKAKILLSSSSVNINDEFLIDSFVTGRQRLRCQGIRIRIDGQREELKGDKNKLPGAGTYISLKQGVYATGSPEIHGVPKIREGVCGSALVRVKKGGKDGRNVLENGEISGFMHWSDLQRRNDTEGKLLCFADAVDDLVAAGWTIVQVPEKTKEAPGEGSYDEVRASKKPRLEA